MTEDQKAFSLILDLLHASKGVPRTGAWIAAEVRYAGLRAEVPALLELLEDKKLIATARDALGVRRHTLTPAGKEALDAL